MPVRYRSSDWGSFASRHRRSISSSSPGRASEATTSTMARRELALDGAGVEPGDRLGTHRLVAREPRRGLRSPSPGPAPLARSRRRAPPTRGCRARGRTGRCAVALERRAPLVIDDPVEEPELVLHDRPRRGLDGACRAPSRWSSTSATVADAPRARAPRCRRAALPRSTSIELVEPAREDGERRGLVARPVGTRAARVDDRRRHRGERGRRGRRAAARRPCRRRGDASEPARASRVRSQRCRWVRRNWKGCWVSVAVAHRHDRVPSLEDPACP